MPITESSRGSLSSSGDTMESLDLEIAGLDNTVEPDTSSYLLETTPYSDQRTFNILRDFLRPERAGPSVSQAALMITNMLPDAPREYGSDDLWGLWSLFVRVAEQISPYDPLLLRLVRLVQRLGDSPKTVFTEKAVDGTENMKRVHLLGDVLRDGFQPPAEETPEALGPWMSRSTFMALLYSFSLVDGSHLAIWQLRRAFEDPAAGPKDISCRVRAAAIWIHHAGEMIVRMVVEPGDVSDADKRSWQPGELFKGSRGYSVARWMFWKRGFAAAADVWSPALEVVETMDILEKTVEM